jgi:hypothetical protein
MEAILVSLVAAVPATIAATAAWRNAKSAKAQTNGMLHEPLEQIRVAVLDTQVRITRVEGKVDTHIQHHN